MTRQIKLSLSHALVAAITRTPEFALKPILSKAIRLIVEKHVMETKK